MYRFEFANDEKTEEREPIRFQKIKIEMKRNDSKGEKIATEYNERNGIDVPGSCQLDKI